jgi:hypothetical protein
MLSQVTGLADAFVSNEDPETITVSPCTIVPKVDWIDGCASDKDGISTKNSTTLLILIPPVDENDRLTSLVMIHPHLGHSMPI